MTFLAIPENLNIIKINNLSINQLECLEYYFIEKRKNSKRAEKQQQ